MRDILFRGKRTDNGAWTSGYLFCVWESAYLCWGMKNNVPVMEEVIPKTVGQYTGLLDKNGRKIFEGDIVKCTATNVDCAFTAVVLFGNSNGEYNWGFQLVRISGANANTDILLWVDREETGAFIEVIGNIYDNPELIRNEV